MSQPNEKKSLPFFGIGKVLPFTKKYRGVMFLMVVCGLMSTGIDLLMPQTQRYALNHFIGENTLDTLPIFIGIYIIGILLMAILFNALTLLGVDGSWQRFIRGFVMVVVIMFDVISKMKKGK